MPDKNNILVKTILVIVALTIVVSGVLLWIKRAAIFPGKAMSTITPHEVSDMKNQIIDKAAIDYITVLDRQNHNATFVFNSPHPGLHITNNRSITLPPLGPDISINFDKYLYKGYSGPIYILLPSRYIGIRAMVYLKCFPGYKGFTLKELSDNYVLYYSNTYR